MTKDERIDELDRRIEFLFACGRDYRARIKELEGLLDKLNKSNKCNCSGESTRADGGINHDYLDCPVHNPLIVGDNHDNTT